MNCGNAISVRSTRLRVAVVRKNVLVTGRPGIGKTTVVLKVADILRARGLVVGGMVSKEVRRGGVRVGFLLRDLLTGDEGYLARVGAGRPRVGKYVVLLDELERVGVGAIERAIRDADVVIIDEIGPMENYSRRFRSAVLEALSSPKPVLATIHVRARRHPFGRQVLSRSDCEVIEVTFSNRNSLPSRIAEKLCQALPPPSLGSI